MDYIQKGFVLAIIVILIIMGAFYIVTAQKEATVQDKKTTSTVCEIPSPSNYFTQDMIKIQGLQKIILYTNDNISFVGVAGTGSMIPVLNQDSTALEIEADAKNLHIGDIISFQSGHGEIIHRIINIVARNGTLFYVTKGDNNEAEDSYATQLANVSGKVVGILY